MTRLEKRFVDEILITPGSTADAYIRAGGKGKNAYVLAWRILQKPEIKEALAIKQKKIADKMELTAEKVLRELQLLGYSNIQDYIRITEDGNADVDLRNVTRDQFAAVEEITSDATGGTGDGERKVVMRTRVKLARKRDALELLGKHLKLYTDVIRHEGLEGLSEKINKIDKREKDE